MLILRFFTIRLHLETLIIRTTVFCGPRSKLELTF